MALITLTGRSLLWPDLGMLYSLGANPSLSSIGPVDAATEQIAFCGRIWWADRTDSTKDITKIHFRAGAVSFGASSQYRVSLQDISLTAGPVMQPDGGVDQSFVSAAGAGPSADAWNTVTLSANRTVTFGELIGIVWDYVTFTAGDSIALSCLATSNPTFQGVVVFYNGTSWSAQGVLANVVLEFTDGTFGGLLSGIPCVALNDRSFTADSTGSGGLNAGDERGLEFTPPAPLRVDGVWAVVGRGTTTSNFDLVLYEGDTAMTGGTISVDGNAVSASALGRIFVGPFSQQITLTANQTYRLVVKPTAGAADLWTITLNAAGHRVLLHGTNAAGNSRADAGPWGTPDTTELPLLGLLVSGVDDGAGGGGGDTKIFVPGGMTGGIRG